MEKKYKELVINRCYGGFGLSRKAFLRLRELGNECALNEPDIGEYWSDGSGPREESFDVFCFDIPRDDPDLIKVVRELGKEANSRFADLAIVQIPADADYKIYEYDGIEWVVYCEDGKLKEV